MLRVEPKRLEDRGGDPGSVHLVAKGLLVQLWIVHEAGDVAVVVSAAAMLGDLRL